MAIHIEIEERALLSADQHSKILKHLKTLGTVQTSRRVMINYTASDYNRTKTVELRLNDGSLSKVVKVGNFGETVKEETTLINAPLVLALADMTKDGFTHAKVSLRLRHVVKVIGYEYCLRDILRFDDPNVHSYPSLFEIESESDSLENEASIRENIRTILNQLGVSTATSDQFKQWSEFNHTKVDGDFIYSPTAAQQLTKTLESFAFLQV